MKRLIVAFLLSLSLCSLYSQTSEAIAFKNWSVTRGGSWDTSSAKIGVWNYNRKFDPSRDIDIIPSGLTPAEALNWIKSHISYKLQDIDKGPVQTIQDGYGCCRDMAFLFQVMMWKSDIPCVRLLVSVKKHGDHMINAILYHGNKLYYDCTSGEYFGTSCPYQIVGEIGLTVQ